MPTDGLSRDWSIVGNNSFQFFICSYPYDILDDIYLTPKDNDIIKLSFNSLGLCPVRRLFTLGSLTNILKFIENDIRNFVLQVVWLSRDFVMWSTKPIFTILSPFFNKSRIEAFWIKQNLVKHVKHNRDMEIYF